MPPLNRYPRPEDASPPVRITHAYPFRKGPPLLIPLLQWRVCAGFPSPADDFAEEPLDLNDLLVKNPPATFMMRCAGRSMEEAGIFDGDLLVVDRSLEAKTGSIVIAYLNGELTVKAVERRGPRLRLVAASERFPAIEITQDMDFEVWGVVTHVVRQLHR